MDVVIEADWAWVDAQRLERDVAVVVRDGLVAEVLRGERRGEVAADAPRMRVPLLLPGFINAHCHVEYTWMRGLLTGGRPFGEWLRGIFSLKRDVSVSAEVIAASLYEGAEELRRGGCTTVFDCGTKPASEEALLRAGLRVFQFVELIGLDDAAGAREMAKFREWCGRPVAARLLGRGLNPHAPYSVGPSLRAALRGFIAEREGVPMAWHMHESVCEMEHFRDDSGALSEFFREAGLMPAYGEHPPGEPESFLRTEGLGRADAWFHYNYPDSEISDPFGDAPRHERPLVVHCPGTHRYFARPPFPLESLRGASYPVALGTDSLASGESLSMLDSLRMAAEEFPGFNGADLLAMVTTTPANTPMAGALRGKLGRISVGCPADFVGLECGASSDVTDLRSVFVDRETRVALTVSDGAVLVA